MMRRAAVAGTWYPDSAPALRAALDTHLALMDATTAAIPVAGDLAGIITPHAGLDFSGAVAAHAYRLLRDRTFDVIVLVGPSHYLAFEGVSIWPRGSFETPLGTVPLDERLAGELMAACPLVHDLPAAHQREHSLELQLPFVAHLAEGTPIVPLLMGEQTRETAEGLGDALGRVLQGRRALVVASSDLSHFYDAASAAALDRAVIAEIERFDADGLMRLLERRWDHACGGGPMVSVLRAARALGATRSTVLRYADSGDESGDKSSVVGYVSAALWRAAAA